MQVTASTYGVSKRFPWGRASPPWCNHPAIPADGGLRKFLMAFRQLTGPVTSRSQDLEIVRLSSPGRLGLRLLCFGFRFVLRCFLGRFVRPDAGAGGNDLTPNT